jgi:hypothetical protein
LHVAVEADRAPELAPTISSETRNALVRVTILAMRLIIIEHRRSATIPEPTVG